VGQGTHHQRVVVVDDMTLENFVKPDVFSELPNTHKMIGFWLVAKIKSHNHTTLQGRVDA